MANNHLLALKLLQIAGTGIAGWTPTGIYSGGSESPSAPNRWGWRKRSYVIETSTSTNAPYQGMPFRSGAFDDCSGKPPATCMSAMSRTPTHAPPIKPATTHQNETIWYPRFPWSRKLPGTDAAPWLRFPRKIRHAPDGFQSGSPAHPRGSNTTPPLPIPRPVAFLRQRREIAGFTIVSFSAVSRCYWTDFPRRAGKDEQAHLRASLGFPCLAVPQQGPAHDVRAMSRDVVFVEVFRIRSKKSEQRSPMPRISRRVAPLPAELVAQARKFFLLQQEFLHISIHALLGTILWCPATIYRPDPIARRLICRSLR